MKLWDRIIGKKAETKSLVLGTTEALGKFLIAGGTDTAMTPQSAKNLYNSSSSVSTPINMIADPISDMKLGLEIDGKLILVHPVLEFMKRPSPFYSQQLFLEVIAKDFLITGEYAVVALGNTASPPIALQPIGPEKLSPLQQTSSDAVTHWIVGGNELPGTYTADMNAKAIRYFDLVNGFRELRHARSYSPADSSLGRGQSELVPASKEARQSILGTSHNISLLENGGSISIAFHFEEDMDPDEFEAIKEKVIATYGGPLKAGSIGVTSGGKQTITELGKTPKDMDFVNLQRLAEKSMAKIYKVPIPLISDERMTQSNYESAILALYDDAILPTAARILNPLSELVLPRFKLDPRKARFVMVQEDITTLSQRRNADLMIRKNIAIETTDELREQLGLETVDGGDVVMIPANFIPLGQDLFGDQDDPAQVAAPVDGSALPGPNGQGGASE